jgi:glycosyltransferase involved in cell wall biosynthesis
MLASYVTLKGHPEFMRNQTGFGYMVYDIAKAVAETEGVDLLATDSRGEAFKSDNILFLKRSWWLFLTHIFQCLPISFVRNLLNAYSGMQRGTKLRVLYYWLMTGYVRSVLKRGNYDVVHIHGCGFATELWMQVCKECSQKFVVTLHGLNSFSDTIKLEPAGKQYERDFLRRVVDGEFPITVISTGMKRLIQKTFNAEDCNNITVVCNSFNIPTDSTTFLVRNKYGIPNDAKVILYVGNISHNKNQEQMVRAFELLPEEIKERTWVLFCGKDHTEDGVLKDSISKSSHRSHLILCGGIEKTMMSAYYMAANGTALLSIAEGFGLSLIEGMYFGLPCMMFKDMDAYEDIYHPCAMIGVEEHSDTAVAEGIVDLLNSQWDKSKIISYSKKFESAIMAVNYLNIYRKVLGV